MADKTTSLTVNSSANMSNIQKAIKELKHNLKALGDSTSIEDVKKKFDAIQESGATAGMKIAEIKRLMNEMNNNGWAGDDMFRQMAQSAVELEKQADLVKNTLKEIRNEATEQSLGEKFESVKNSTAGAESKLKDLKGMLTELMATGQTDIPLFQEILNEAAECQEQIRLLSDAEKEINDLLNQTPQLSISEQFDAIVGSSKSAKDQLAEVQNLLAQMKISGEDNTLQYQYMVDKAKELNSEINRTEEAAKAVNQEINSIPELTLDEKFRQIASETTDANKSLKEMTSLIAEAISQGQEDTPLFTEMVEHAQNLKAEVDSANDSMERARELISGIDQTAVSMTVSEKFDKITSSVSDLNQQKKELKQLAVEYIQTENGNKSDEVYVRIKERVAELNRTLEETKKIEQDIEEQTKKIDFSGLANGLAGIGSTLAGLSGMFGGFGDSAVNSILKVQSAMATLQGVQSMTAGGASALGPLLTNPYVAGAAAIGACGAALYSYNEQLDESLKRTEQFTGLSGNELMSLRNGIKATGDTFGKDYNTMLASVDGMMQQFGISGEHALDVIRDGFIAGADDNGKMLDMMDRYAPAFADMGVSAEEFTAILANTRSGIFSEEGMGLIAKAGQKLREFSSQTAESLEAVGIDAQKMFEQLQSGELSTIDAVKQVSAAMKQTGVQTQAAGNIMKNVFGKAGAQGGAELIASLEDIETNLDIIKNQTGEWGDAMKELDSANRELENAMASLFRVGNGGWAEMTTKIKTKVIRALADLLNYFIDLYNDCLLVRGAVSSIVTSFKLLWDVAKMVVKNISALFKGLAKAVEGLLTFNPETMRKGLTEAFQKIADTTVDFAKEFGQDFADGFNQALNGRIEKIEVPTEYDDKGRRTSTESGDNVDTKLKSGNKTGNKNNSNKIDYTVTIDDGSVESAKKKLEAFKKMKLTIPLDDTKSLEECDKNIRHWEIELEKRQINLGIKLGRDELRKIHDDINSLKEKRNNIDIELNPEKYDAVNRQIDELIKRRVIIESALNMTEIMTQFRDIEAHIANLEYQKTLIDIELNPEEYQDIVNRLNELHSKRESIKLEIDSKLAPASLNEISNEISRLQKERNEIDIELNPERVEEINTLIEELKERQFELSIAVGEIADTPLIRLQHKIQKLEAEKLKLNPEINQEEIDKINRELNDLFAQERVLNIKYGKENDYSYRSKEETFSKGGLMDKRESYNNALSDINNSISDYNIGLKNKDEVLADIEEINQALIQLGLNPIQIEIDGSKIQTTTKEIMGLSDKISAVAGAFSGLANSIGQVSDNEAVAKAALIASAVGQLALSFASAMKGTFTPFDWIAGAVAGVSVLTSVVAQLQSFSTGGIVQGSFGIDNQLVKATPGEMILTNRQQKNLFNLLDSNSNNAMGGNVEFIIDGKNLKGVLNNVNKINKKMK